MRHVFQILAQLAWDPVEPIDPVGSYTQLVEYITDNQQLYL